MLKKVAKYFLVIAVPVLILAGCCKSRVKPRCDGNHTQTTDQGQIQALIAPTTTGVQNSEGGTSEGGNSPLVSPGGVIDDEGDKDVVASGDDDRDGGDKKKKR
jgi:CDGSH-type Zn-finger protein